MSVADIRLISVAGVVEDNLENFIKASTDARYAPLDTSTFTQEMQTSASNIAKVLLNEIDDVRDLTMNNFKTLDQSYSEAWISMGKQILSLGDSVVKFQEGTLADVHKKLEILGKVIEKIENTDKILMLLVEDHEKRKREFEEACNGWDTAEQPIPKRKS